MPVFEIESGGKTFEVEAPDMNAAVSALGAMQPQQPAFSGSLLPLSRDAQGNVSFDSNAGIVGDIKRHLSMFGETAAGQFDPLDPKNTGRVLGAAAMLTPAGVATRAGEAAVPGAIKSMVPGKPSVPSAKALKAAAGNGYTAARDMGVEIRADAVKNWGATVRSELEQDGVIAELAPKTFAILQKLTTPPEGGFATLAGIDAARKALRNAAKDFTNKTEQLAASRAISSLDDFATNLPPQSVLAGPAAAASKVLGEARGNYAAAMRSDKITGATERAELNAAVANSGQNLDNAVRQRLRDILVKPKEAAGYNSQELAQIEKTARGGAGTNLARFMGNLLGGGGGLGAAVTGMAGVATGAATAGPVGAAVGGAAPALGYISKKIANALTQRSASKADELTRMRSPLYENAPPNMVAMDPLKRDALVRALMLYGLQPPPQ